MEAMVELSGYWKGKRVLVTGHTGFKGSWLCLWLQSMGAEVIGISLAPPTNPSLFDVANVAREMKSLNGDIRQPDVVRKMVAEARPEVVFHLAAQSLVRPSYRDPIDTYMTNVMGTAHVLDAVRHTNGVRAVVVVTSDKCYENKEWLWGYRENEAMGGYDPYSSSKGCAELVTDAYRRSYFNVTDYQSHHVALASVRAGNVIGGGDWAEDRLVPDLMRAFMDRRPVRIRNPNALRPWQHVLEPLAGYLILAHRLCEGGAPFAEGWNFGPNTSEARPVSWIVAKAAEIWGDNARWEADLGHNPHEAQLLRLDCTKAQTKLPWSPRLNVEQALRLTVAWYQSYAAREDMRAVTVGQIQSYFDDKTV